MYDESWCPQLTRLPCKDRNDRYETDSGLVRLFYVRKKIKIYPSWKSLSQIYSADENESKGIIVGKFSTEEDES